MEDLVLDPTGMFISYVHKFPTHVSELNAFSFETRLPGLREITAYLKKEYCHENIRFWLAVRDMKYGPASQLRPKAQQIYK